MFFPLQFIKSQLLTSIPYPDQDFSGQTIIVTGANTGLGREAARHLVRLNASKVIIAVRDVAKGQIAATDIVESCKVSPATVDVWSLDLSNYESIKSFCQRAGSLDRLDGVLQNAGIMPTKFSVLEDQESTITVNVIGATLLGLLVLPKLQSSAEKTGLRGRLEFVGSDLQYIAMFKEAETSGTLMDALKDEKTAVMGDRYKVSKLLLLYVIRELAAKNPLSDKSNVIITCLTPGACRSDIFRDEAPWLQSVIMSVALNIFARTTEVGARTLVHGVSPDLGPEAHGAFIMDCKVAENGENIDGERGQRLAKKWNAELFPLLYRLM